MTNEADTQLHSLVVLGAGPAGLAAASQAAQLGVDTLLLDEQDEPGGQIYRAITTTPMSDRRVLGEDYWRGAEIVESFRQSASLYWPKTTVWSIVPLKDGGLEIAYSRDGQSHLLQAKRLLIATGAQERPFPFPGWTLPGVLTAGAAQILLKSGGVAPQGHTVLAGSGPLLYLLAWQYLNAGVKVDALLETTPRGRLAEAFTHAFDFVRSPYFKKGVSLLASVRRAIPIVRHVETLEALGTERVEAVRFEAEGRSRTLPVDQLLIHQGVVPNVNLCQALGAAMQWNDRLRCWEPTVDHWGATSVPGVSLAGDGAGIAGAAAAALRGRISALRLAESLGKLSPEQCLSLSAPLRKALLRAERGRAFFDILYRPAQTFRSPSDETIVCRCEEVSAGQVRAAVRHGCSGPNQLKAFLRCGMGPCQGRFCGLTVTEVMANALNRTPEEVGRYRLRYPTKPLTLGEMASLPQSEASRAAVIRFKAKPSR